MWHIRSHPRWSNHLSYIIIKKQVETTSVAWTTAALCLRTTTRVWATWALCSGTWATTCSTWSCGSTGITTGTAPRTGPASREFSSRYAVGCINKFVWYFDTGCLCSSVAVARRTISWYYLWQHLTDLTVSWYYEWVHSTDLSGILPSVCLGQIIANQATSRPVHCHQVWSCDLLNQHWKVHQILHVQTLTKSQTVTRPIRELTVAISDCTSSFACDTLCLFRLDNCLPSHNQSLQCNWRFRYKSPDKVHNDPHISATQHNSLCWYKCKKLPEYAN